MSTDRNAAADFRIEAVTEANLDAAAEVHADSWQSSHAAICAPPVQTA